MSHYLSREVVQQALNEQGTLVDLGQIAPAEVRALNKAAKQGQLVKYRGYWNTRLPFAGIGPLKTIWALPEVAALVPGIGA